MNTRHCQFFAILGVCSLAISHLQAADYHVGPDQPLKTIADAPWASLAPGDTVLIHWRPAPYKEKWVICRRGTPKDPIVVRGVPGPHGELPAVDGAGATTPASLDYSGDLRAVIKIGSARTPADLMPSDLVIEGLDVANAYPTNSFHGRHGPGVYSKSAASIWVEKGERIAIRNCTIHGSGNGIFVSPASRSILVDACRIFGNGVEKDIYEHNVYTEADGMIFQHNHFGPLRAGSGGNNVKDRSAGLIVRNNWIEGGNRNLDLVDAEDSPALRNLPSYRRTYVYGNVIVKLPSSSNKQVVHYGGDSGKPDWYRKGTLFFFNNTVVSKRLDGTTLFRLETNEEHVDARNNIFFTVGRGKSLAMVDSTGRVDLSANWLPIGWVNCHGAFSGIIQRGKGNIEGVDPGFINAAAGEYGLKPNSPCRGAGALAPVEGKPAGTGPVDIGATQGK